MSQSPQIGSSVQRLFYLQARGATGLCRNPLKSGQAFKGRSVMSKAKVRAIVAIPSNRVKRSKTRRAYSPMPTICVAIPSNRVKRSKLSPPRSWRGRGSCRNPLKSGQAFKANRVHPVELDELYVAIPSNRVKRSNELYRGQHH